VARDRQRAKQRRAKRQPGAGGPAAGSRRAKARDIGLDQAEADDAGLGNTTPPEPTKHAMPNVEEAELAEAGAFSEDDPAEAGAIYEDELDPDAGAPDEVEGDLVPAGRPGAAERDAHARPRKRRSGVIGFLGHCVDELKRVQWPDRRQVGQGTAVTLGFTVLAGGYLGLLDAIWKPLIEAIL
jgi:preprotein translocase SecE subunit